MTSLAPFLQAEVRSQAAITQCPTKNLSPLGLLRPGSILGPLLFVIYMNDLPDVLEHCSFTLYADNTVLSFKSKSITKIELKLNSDINRVKNWMQINQLTFIKIKKSKFMLIPVLTVLGSSSKKDGGGYENVT